MKIKANRKNAGRRPVKAAANGKIPYDLVSSLVILRDWAELNSDDYVSDEHKQLVDIADFLYNADLPADNLKPEAKKVYDKYGESYFDKVLEDVSAIDSQISHNNVNDLIEEYNDKVNEYMGWGVNAACNKKSVKSSSRQRRSVTAAADLSDNKIIVQSKAVVEVYEDDWEQGEGKYVNGWEFDISGEYNSIDAVISQISNTVFAFSDNKADYYFMDGALRTSATVNNDNETPSEAEKERWMQGQEMMYTAYLYLYLGVGSIHEMTDEEAEAYGLTVE